MNTNFLQIIDETEAEFFKIADQLLNHSAIKNHEAVYRLTEIEFYWMSKKHQDPCTYKRIHTEPKNGDWFFHYSGVDIALRNSDLEGYGGILIRSIYNINENKKYKGPMVSAMKLFSGTSAFSQSIQTRIISHAFEALEIESSVRKNLGKNAKAGNTDHFKYNFSIFVP
jgi:hypothetical protein